MTGVQTCALPILIKEVVGYKGKLVYDKTKPDGTMLKLMDVSKINQLGWKAKTELREGLKIAYEDFWEKYSRKNA